MQNFSVRYASAPPILTASCLSQDRVAKAAVGTLYIKSMNRTPIKKKTALKQNLLQTEKTGRVIMLYSNSLYCSLSLVKVISSTQLINRK